MDKDRVIIAGALGAYWSIAFALIGLKLSEAIDWPWASVLAPLYLPPLGFLIGLGLGFLYEVIVYLCLDKQA